MESATICPNRRSGVILNRLGEPLLPVPKWTQTAGGQWIKLTPAGTSVDEDHILELDVVLACVRVIAESIAALPLELFKVDEKKDEITSAVGEKLYDLLRWVPCPEYTAYERTFITMVDAIIRGFGVTQVIRDASGKPVELWPLEARYIRAGRTSAKEGNRLVFIYTNTGVSRPQPVLLEMEDILIVRSFNYGGLLGSSMTRMAANALGGALAAEDFTAEFFKNGAAPSGTIEIPDELTDEAYLRLKKDWKESHTGKGNRHRAPILEGGAKFNPLSLTNQESQLLETMKYKRSTIAGFLRVPAHLINDLEKATYSNIEHTDLGFVKHSLRPWLTNIEQRCALTLLSPEERKRYTLVHDLTDLLRGDFPARMEGFAKAVSAGIMAPNEVRRKERMNPYEGGDIYLVQGALRDITQPYQPSGGGQPTPTAKELLS